MLNPGDKVLVYRNGHLITVGIAGPTRGFSQNQIAITYGDSYSPACIDVDRNTGVNQYHEVKYATEQEWIEAVEKLHQHHILVRLKEEETRRLEEEELDRLGTLGEEWYKTLPPEQQKMIDALVWKWRPIAIA